MTASRLTFALAASALLAWLGWITIQATRADLLAAGNPGAALRIDPDHPRALLRIALEKLRAKDYDAATSTARRLLAVAPGQGQAFAVIALAAVASGDADADRLLAIAVHRAPRSRDVHLQSAASALRAGKPAVAMAQIDALLRVAPGLGAKVYPGLIGGAGSPAFARALVETLATSPPWRSGFLATLGSQGEPAAVDNIHAGLRRRGALGVDETGRWLDRMLADGRWGQAYAHWIATLGPLDSLPSVYDGGFERKPGNQGFSWRNEQASGAFTDIEPAAGAGGTRAAHTHFIGLQAATGNLRQALLLAPGRYRMRLRAKAEFLHSDQGLQWIVRCDKGTTLVRIGPLAGSFEWRPLDAGFEVPSTGCSGQWLLLENPAVAGSAQQVSGDLWTDDITIAPIGGSTER